MIENTIRAKDLDCLRTYEISDVSGTDVRKNADIIEILQLVATRVIDGIVVADLDRLFRPDQPTDFAILQVFKDTGAIIYSGDTTYDLSSKDGMLFSSIRAAMSGWELGVMKERQQGAKEEKRKRGHCPSNRLTMPFGTTFNREQQRWEWTPEAAIVAEVFRLVDEDGERNYSRIGKQFGVTGQTIRNWLRNPIYTGWRIWNQKRGDKRVSRSGKTYRVKVNRAEDAVIRVRVLDPLVSEERFKRVQKIAKEIVFNHIERLKKDQTVNYSAGLLICGVCGERCYCSSGKRTDGPRHGYVMCRANYYLYRKKLGGCTQPNLSQAYADELVDAFACQTLTSAKTLTALIEGSLQRTAEVVRSFPTTKADARSFKVEKARLLKAYRESVIELETLQEELEQLRRIAAAKERSTVAQTRKEDFDLESFARLVVRGAHRLRRIIDRKEKKTLIHALFESVIIKKDSIVGFKLRSDLQAANSSEAAASGLIYLEPPFRLAPAKEELPTGQKRCIRCQSVLSNKSFRTGNNRCRDCVTKQAHEAYKRRRSVQACDRKN